MKSRCLVTIADHRTQAMAILMFKSLKKSRGLIGQEIPYDLFLLTAKGFELSEDLLQLCYDLNIQVVSFEFMLNCEDPYYIKFLLLEFLQKFYYETMLYLDPDHIFFKVIPVLEPISNCILMSSESTLFIANEYIKEIANQDSFINFNSSFIYASHTTWLNATKNWKDFYKRLGGHICNRYREEIAFSLSAMSRYACIIQVSRKLQANFKEFEKDCCVFHYGGESFAAKSIKELLHLKGIYLEKALFEKKRASNDEKERWLLTEISRILKV